MRVTALLPEAQALLGGACKHAILEKCVNCCHTRLGSTTLWLSDSVANYFHSIAAELQSCQIILHASTQQNDVFHLTVMSHAGDTSAV